MFDIETVLDGISSIVRGLTDFSSSNVVKEDITILDTGAKECVIISSAGTENVGDDNERMFGYNSVSYTVEVEVFRQYIRHAEDREQLRSAAKDIAAELSGHYEMDGDAERLDVESISGDNYWGKNDGSGPFYISRIISLNVVRHEEIN